MRLRAAGLADIDYCKDADVRAGMPDRDLYWRFVLPQGGCFCAGRGNACEGIVASGVTFFSRPFVSPLFVEATARRAGLGAHGCC